MIGVPCAGATPITTAEGPGGKHAQGLQPISFFSLGGCLCGSIGAHEHCMAQNLVVWTPPLPPATQKLWAPSPKNGHFALKPPKTIAKQPLKGDNACNCNCKMTQCKLVGFSTDLPKILWGSTTVVCAAALFVAKTKKQNGGGKRRTAPLPTAGHPFQPSFQYLDPGRARGRGHLRRVSPSRSPWTDRPASPAQPAPPPPVLFCPPACQGVLRWRHGNLKGPESHANGRTRHLGPWRLNVAKRVSNPHGIDPTTSSMSVSFLG